MNSIAIKMLIGDRSKYIGILVGVTFASLLITWQAAIFVGIMTRAYGTISDIGQPDIWVMDSRVQYIDDLKPLKDTQLYQVRGVEGVDWAVPLYRGMLRTRLDNGNFQTCIVMGLDDTTLMGGPPEMIEGTLADLRRSDGVIVDISAANGKLAKPPSTPDGKPVPLKIGDTLELNDHRAVVVGICKITRAILAYPILYTTYLRAVTFAPQERKLLSFVLVKSKPGQDIQTLCNRINRTTKLGAFTSSQFRDKTVTYFLKYTGIPVNFGIAVILAFVVGTVIAGQTFYNFTLENLRYFGTLKAMGATDIVLLRMILLQAILVGGIGYGLGVGTASFMGYLTRDTELSFRLLWESLAVTAAAVTIICALAAFISMRKVIKLEPAIVFKS